jgi:hypothetical protein
LKFFQEFKEQLEQEIAEVEEKLVNLRAATAALMKLQANDLRNVPNSINIENAPLSTIPFVTEVTVTSIPTLGEQFWLDIFGSKTRTTADLVTQAMAELNAAEDWRPVVSNRLSAWLYPAIRAGKVQVREPKNGSKLKGYRIL